MSPGADESGGRGPLQWADLDEQQLIAEMRRGVDAAFTEVYRRFAPLLHRMAQRRRVAPADQEALVTEHLENTLIPVLEGRRRAPAALGAYLAAGFRRRLVSAWRTREAGNENQRSLQLTSDDRRERVVAEGLSEYALRTALTWGG